jgi:agmatinase
VLTAREAEDDPDRAAGRLLEILGDPVYITIDLDCLDPSILPATGTPEPGGLTWRTLTGLLRRVAESRHVVGFDVTELSPIPGFVAPEFLAARLAFKTLGYVFHARRAAR